MLQHPVSDRMLEALPEPMSTSLVEPDVATQPAIAGMPAWLAYSLLTIVVWCGVRGGGVEH